MEASRSRSRFPKPCRLKANSDFQRLRREGRRRHGRYMMLVSARGRSGCPRLGVVVSKRVGNAVVRNRWRRRIREIFRRELFQTISDRRERPRDFVVIVRSSGRAPTLNLLKEDILGLV